MSILALRKLPIRIRIICVCIGLLFSYPESLFTQNQRISFENLGIKEGLPSVNVFDIIQDQQGYIWLSTLNGLVKYDGYTYKTFRKDTKDSVGLSPVGRSFTTSLLAKDGTIWVSTLISGFSHLDPYTERFTNFPNPPKEEGEAEFARTYLVKEDAKGRIWMFEIDVPTRRARVKNYDPETDSVSTFEVGHAFTGRITIKRTFQRFLVEDQDGGIWVHDPEKGVFKYDEESQEFLLLLASGKEGVIKGNTQQIIVDRDNQLWIATDQGVQVYDIENQRWNKEKLGEQAFSFVHALYQDQQGNIWLSPEGQKVWRYSAQDQQLQSIALKDDLSVKGFPTYYLQAVAEDEEGVWFANDVPRFLAYNRKFVYYQHKTQSFTYYGERFNQPQNQPNYLPLAFLRDDSGLLWITNNGSGINKQNPLSQRIDQWKYVADDVYSLGVDTLTNVQEDLDKDIWIMGYGKIQQFDPSNSTFNSFSPVSDRSVKFNSLVDNGEGSLWLGSDQGLYLFDKVKNRFQLKLPMGKGEANSLTPLFFDQDEKLWIRFNGESYLGESGQALAIFDPN
ncbi:MAG: two-component regulator propeller domain-containing protein, partial [Bacteroidota bacterium]